MVVRKIHRMLCSTGLGLDFCVAQTVDSCSQSLTGCDVITLNEIT